MKRIIKTRGLNSTRVEVYSCNFRTRRVEMKLYDSSSPLFVFHRTFYCNCSSRELILSFYNDVDKDFVEFMRYESSDVHMMRSPLSRPLYFKQNGNPTTRYFEF